jgi:hypothetical protein
MLEGPGHQPQVVEISTVVPNECDDSNDRVRDQCWKDQRSNRKFWKFQL